MGLFWNDCANCGSKEHATKDCPHGIFSSKCAHCGSTEHAASDCPHGLFSSKCAHCGSTEHVASDCPHGIFSSKCAHCESTEHTTNECPHGIFSSKCANCGSVNHSTDQCPHRLFGSSTSQSTYQTPSYSSSDSDGDDGCFIKAIAILVAVALAIWFIFSIAIPIILINAATIALIAGFVKRDWSKFLFPLAIAGGVLIILDYNLGWFTVALKENISLSDQFIKVFYYLNVVASLIAVYFLVRDFLHAKYPQTSSSGEFTKRNTILIFSLFLAGVLILVAQNQFGSNKITIGPKGKIGGVQEIPLQPSFNSLNVPTTVSSLVNKYGKYTDYMPADYAPGIYIWKFQNGLEIWASSAGTADEEVDIIIFSVKSNNTIPNCPFGFTLNQTIFNDVNSRFNLRKVPYSQNNKFKVYMNNRWNYFRFNNNILIGITIATWEQDMSS